MTKQKGATMEYAKERLQELMHQFNHYHTWCDQLHFDKCCQYLAQIQASRFWCSPQWASKIITAMLQGKQPYYKMRPLKQEMFKEIYNRVLKMKTDHPDWSTLKCCTFVVEQPAPKHYLSPGSIRIMISQERKKRRELWQQKQRHSSSL